MTSIYRLILRSIGTRGRLIAMSVLGAISIVIAVFLGRSSSADADGAARLVDAFGLSLIVPIIALVIASASFGNLIEDRTLVYLWLRPIPPWKIVLAAYAAALSVVLPLTVIPLTLTALVAGGTSEMVIGSVVAVLVGAIAYSAVFLTLGLMLERALAWGLGYIILWEGVIASIGRGPSRLALRSYSRSALSSISKFPLDLGDLSLPIALVVPALVATAALALASWRLGSKDVA